MGKLKDLAMVKSGNASNFAYLPPDAAFDAGLILVKPAFGHNSLSSSGVSLHVLDAVLRGLRRASPLGRIVIIEGVSADKDVAQVFDDLGVISLIDKEMRITDSDNLIMNEYPNLLPEPLKFSSMMATGYLKGYDCVISLASGGDTFAPSLQNLPGIFPQRQYEEEFKETAINDLLTDTYFTIGQYFHGFIVDLSESSEDDFIAGKVVWGDDALAVDEVACQIMDKPSPDIIGSIRQLAKQLS